MTNKKLELFNDGIRFLAGTDNTMQDSPLPVFNEKTLEFLGTLSKNITSSPKAREDQELYAYGFWIRPGRLKAMKEAYKKKGVYGQDKLYTGCIGRGITFHIAPSNVPLMYAYSMTVALLAGNSCIVRVSERVADVSPGAGLFLEILKDTLKEYPDIKERISIITYSRDNIKATGYYSLNCDVRVIWGGDDAIQSIGAIPIKPGAVDIPFHDRYSAALIDGGFIDNMSEDELNGLIHRFYNDTYTMDQNACSSPGFIFWMNGKDSTLERFYSALANKARAEYELDAFRAVRRLESLYQASMDGDCPKIGNVRHYGEDYLIVAELNGDGLFSKMPEYHFGLFYDIKIDSLEAMLPFVDERLQTLCFCGADSGRGRVREMVIKNGVKGIDRIVGFGEALMFDTVWDGRDLILEMSREIK